MFARQARLAQGDLQMLRLLDSVAVEHPVNGLIAGDKRQTVGGLKSFLRQRASLPVRAQAHGRLVDHMQGQARLQLPSRLAGPAQEQVPSAQAQMPGHQQPDADLISGNLVGEQLPDLLFEALGVSRSPTLLTTRALGLNKLGWVGRIKGSEFFL